MSSSKSMFSNDNASESESEVSECESQNQFSVDELIEAYKKSGKEIGSGSVDKISCRDPRKQPLEPHEVETPEQLTTEENLPNSLPTIEPDITALCAHSSVNVNRPSIETAAVSESIQKPNPRKKSRRAAPATWESSKNRKKRMEGFEYESYKKGGKKGEKVDRPARKLGPRCSSKECSKRKTRHCQSFLEEQRKELFGYFWNELSWGEKQAQVRSLVDKHRAKRQTKENSARMESYHYHLKREGMRLQVCKDMFMNTLGIKQHQLRNWLIATTPKRSRNQYALANNKAESAAQFLDALPKLPSHYCRKDTDKLYLEPTFTTNISLFKEYKKYCEDHDLTAVSASKFMEILRDKNISLFQRKKDKCDTCVSYEAGNLPEDVWKEHKQRKENARLEKDADKAAALEGKCHVLTMDMEAVKLCPMLNASALYYKTKLCVHNFTIFNLDSKDVRCYLWDESEAGLVASVFATCVRKYLNTLDIGRPVIIYSDGCTNQNRNNILANALLHWAMERKTVVIQKYLEKGHTQMEVDSAHSLIERKLKNEEIYLPYKYADICRKARSEPTSFCVEYLSYSDFLDFSNPSTLIYESIRPGRKGGESCVTHLKQIKYCPDGKIQYKLHYMSDWMDMPREPREASNAFQPLYKQKLSIPKRKFQDLMDLLPVIPAEHHWFYESLPHK